MNTHHQKHHACCQKMQVRSQSVCPGHWSWSSKDLCLWRGSGQVWYKWQRKLKVHFQMSNCQVCHKWLYSWSRQDQRQQDSCDKFWYKQGKNVMILSMNLVDWEWFSLSSLLHLHLSTKIMIFKTPLRNPRSSWPISLIPLSQWATSGLWQLSGNIWHPRWGYSKDIVQFCAYFVICDLFLEKVPRYP